MSDRGDSVKQTVFSSISTKLRWNVVSAHCQGSSNTRKILFVHLTCKMCQIKIVKGTGFPCATKSYAIIFRQM